MNNHQISISIDEVESPPRSNTNSSPIIDSPDFFAFSSISDRFSRRRSRSIASINSSIDSFRSSSKFELYNQEQFPGCEEDLIELAKDIGQNFKKTHQIKEVLSNCPWFKDTPNAQCDRTGNTLLHIAAKLDEYKLVSALCRLKPTVDIDLLNNEGNSALHLSAEEGHVAIVDNLLKHGSEAMTQTNKQG